MTKEEIINNLIQTHGYVKYLEIGYGSGYCFARVQCTNKEAVDPYTTSEHDNVYAMTSDQLFEDLSKDEKFDIIFIDGLHHAEQVRKDINNASKHLTEKGCIVIHDIEPEDEAQQTVPKQQKVWTGDVWRAWDGFKKKYPDVHAETYPVQYGLGVIFPNGKVFRAHFEDMKTTWQERK